jgi:hypothetical protein
MARSEIFNIFTSKLNEAGFPYFITGSVAAMYYGTPRLTHDVDIVLNLFGNQIKSFTALFSPDKFYIPPEETLLMETSRRHRGHFNLIHLESGYKADIYLLGSDKLHHWAMERRKNVNFLSEQIYIAPPEYVIIRKLEFYREGGSEKHLEDIGNMLSVSSRELNTDFLIPELETRGLIDIWDKIKADSLNI